MSVVSVGSPTVGGRYVTAGGDNAGLVLSRPGLGRMLCESGLELTSRTHACRLPWAVGDGVRSCSCSPTASSEGAVVEMEFEVNG